VRATLGALLGCLALVALAGCGDADVTVSSWSPALGTELPWPAHGGQPAPLPVAHEDPSAGTAVVWTVDATDPEMLVATDWQGDVTGWMEFAGPIHNLGDQSPDGSRIEIGNALYSSDGDLIADNVAGGTWADDSQHLCEVLGPNGGPAGARMVQTSANTFEGVASPAWLYVSLPGQYRRPIVQVGDFSPHGNIDVASCSLKSDEALVTSSFTASTTHISEYQLSTGRLLYSATPASSIFGVAATHDGRLLAEDDASCDGSVIRDLSQGGREVGQIQGAYVKAFSWDSTELLTTGPLGNPSYVPTEVAIRSLSTGARVWSAELPPSDLDVKPAGSEFLLGVPPVSAGYEALSESVFIVDDHGAVTQVAAHAEVAGGSGVESVGVGVGPVGRTCQ
jgi:hypothetical protein